MSASQIGVSEVAIFSRILELDRATLSVAAAKAILALGFSDVDKKRMHELSIKAQEGSLTTKDRTAINSYERARHILSLMKSKARRSLNAGRASNGKTKTR